MLKKKSISLLIPYIFFNIVWMSLLWLGGDAVESEVSLGRLLEIWKEPIRFSWFLYILYWISILYGILSLFLKNNLHLLYISVGLFLISIFFPSPIYILQRTAVWGICFMIGAVFRSHLTLLGRKTLLSLLLLCVVYTLIWIKFGNERISYTEPGLWGVIIPISSLIGLTTYPVLSRLFLGNHFQFAGKYALEVYLYHSIVISVYRIVLVKLGIMSPFIHLIVGIPITWLATLGLSHISRKLKVFDFFMHPLDYLE